MFIGSLKIISSNGNGKHLNPENAEITISREEYDRLVCRNEIYKLTMQGAFKGAPIMIVKNEFSQYVDASFQFLKMINATSRREIFGKTDWDFFPEDFAKQAYAEEKEVMKTGKIIQNKEIMMGHSVNGAERWYSITIEPYYQNQNKGVVCFWNDITEHKNKILLDTDTGLLKRNPFLEDIFPRYMTLADQNKKILLCAFVDLNGFKAINDLLGHQVGDAVLSEMADRLRACDFRVHDVICRYGGDEFSILFLNVKKGKDNLKRIADKILKVFEPEFVVKYRREKMALNVTVSLGISEYPNEGRAVSTLVTIADERMYLAKAQSKDERQHEGRPIPKNILLMVLPKIVNHLDLFFTKLDGNQLKFKPLAEFEMGVNEYKALFPDYADTIAKLINFRRLAFSQSYYRIPE
jgi:diguanylate cyclase (GGDEF)-like protein/PAS domain S-box-containing protein